MTSLKSYTDFEQAEKLKEILPIMWIERNGR